MRWTRFAALAAAALAIVAVALGLALRSLDLRALEGPLADRVRSATGRELRIEDELSVHLGLRPSLRLAGLSLANPDWAASPELLRVDHFEVQLALWPLLLRRLEVSRVLLRGVQVWLETDARGRQSWDFAAAGAGGGAAKAPEEDAEDAGRQALSATLGDLLVEDVHIEIRDAGPAAARQVVLESLRAHSERDAARLVLTAAGRFGDWPIHIEAALERAGGLFSSAPLDISLSARAAAARLDVEGRVTPPEAALRLQLRVGETRAHGPLSVDWGGDRPRLDLKLASERLRLEDIRIVTPATEAEADPKPKRPAAASENERQARGDRRLFSAERLPLEGLRELDARLEVDVAEVVAEAVLARGVALRAGLDGGVLRAEISAATPTGGAATIALDVDASRRRPSLALRARLKALEVGALVAALGGADALSGGVLEADVELAGRGRSVRALLGGLEGHLDASLGPGRLRGDWAHAALVALKTALAPGAGTDGIVFHCAVSDFDVRAGVARARGLAWNAPGVAVLGSGRVDLRREKLALRLDPIPAQRSLAGLAPPLAVSGRLAEPRVRVDAKGLGDRAAAALLGLHRAPGAAARIPTPTQPGVAGCRELLEARARAARAEPAAGTGTRPAKPEAVDALERVGKELGKLFGR